MSRISKGRVAAAVSSALALGGLFGITPRILPAANAVQASNANKDQTTPAAPSVQAPAVVEVKTRGFGFATRHPVWIGIKKRGNRRNRSRFNYNR